MWVLLPIWSDNLRAAVLNAPIAPIAQKSALIPLRVFLQQQTFVRPRVTSSSFVQYSGPTFDMHQHPPIDVLYGVKSIALWPDGACRFSMLRCGITTVFGD